MSGQAHDPVVGITGMSGYLGSVIGEGFRTSGWQTVALGRRPAAGPDVPWRHFDLADGPSAGLLAGLDVLVHCAYDMQAYRRDEVWRRNVEGSRRLLEAGREVRRTIVLSSMSAYDGTEQVYGQAKLAIERHASAAGAVIVRPGLVWGPAAGGMAGTLRRLSRLPLTPVISGAGHQFTVHEDDLADAVVALATADPLPLVPIGLAHPQPVPFRDLVKALARLDGHEVRFVRVGRRLPHRALRVIERLPRSPAIRADSLLGLVRPASAVPGQDVVRALGLSFRPLVPTSQVEARRRSDSRAGTDHVSGRAAASSRLS